VSRLTEAFIGPKKANPVRAITTTNVAAASPAAPLLPPVHVRSRNITGLTATEISRMSKNDSRMGDSSENVWINTYKAATSSTMRENGGGLKAGLGFVGVTVFS
jgi:hypothetical protein